jgi:hypothetical protein
MLPRICRPRSPFFSLPVWGAALRCATLAALSFGAAASLVTAESTPPPPPATAPVDFAKDIAPVIKKFCSKCHTGDEPEGDFSLYFTREQDFIDRVSSEREFFEKMVENLRDRKMPPDDAPQPQEAERDRLVEWVERKLLAPPSK